MSLKKYSFAKILAEYNKKYKTYHIIPPTVCDVVIVHDTEKDVFYVTYSSTIKILQPKKSLVDFTFHHISHNMSWRYIVQIILKKEAPKPKIKIKVWPSTKIKYAYLYTNYFAKVGQLGNSCMRSKEMQKSLNFYIKNNVKIIVATDGSNKIYARALLWENIKSTDRKLPFTYMDRVYSSSDTLLPLFYDLATENKWKRYGSTSAGKGIGTYYIDNLNIKGVCHLPYTDTFRYLYYKDNFIAGSTNNPIRILVKNKDTYVSLTHTGEGGYQPALDKDRVKEVITNNFISKKDGVFVKRYKGYVSKKNIADINGDYYSKHDNKIVESKLDKFILVENSVNEILTNEVMDKMKATYSPKHNGYIHKSNLIHIKGDLYHKVDTDIICYKGKWYHISECFINYDREKRNIALSKKKFHSWIKDEVFVPYPDDFVVREDGMIPKECAIIAYDLVYNPVSNSIEYQEVYCTSKTGLIRLTTGELIKDSSANRVYIKKFNNKWCLKQDFKLPDKNQLTFSFMSTTKST